MACKSRRRKTLAPGCKPRATPARWALAMVLAAWATNASAATQVLEDFENIPAKSTAQAVREGKAVTHGQQAAMLRAGESVLVDMTALDANTVAWLKVDTMTTQAFAQPLDMSFRSKSGSTIVHLVAHVQPGSDTVWLPISAFLWRFGGEWPGPLNSMVLKNTGAEAITIDYVRAEPPAAAPDASKLIDFGPSRQIRWPGFRRGDEKESHIVWPNTYTARGASRDFPDGLTGDYVGPTSPGSTHKISLTAPRESGAYVWAWLTHDFQANFPPTDYALQVAGKNVLQKRISASRFFSPEGLLRGMDGEWTADWYAKDFANQLCDQVGFSLRGGPNEARLLNCQFAAMAIAPPARQRELREYVSMVNRDLERFRRQFVVATRRDALCAIQPTAEQSKAGMMVFDPNSDRPFDALWTPQDANEVRLVTRTVVPGQMAMVALAVVPTRPLAYLTTGVEGFTGPAGPLKLTAQGSEAWVVRRVPNAHEGRVQFVPWLLERRSTGLAKDAVVHVAAAVWVADNAAPGVYKGNVLIRSNVGTVRAAVEIRVVQARPLAAVPTYVPTYFLYPTRLYGGLGESLPKSRAAMLRRSFYSQLLPGGINALWLAGPDYDDKRFSDTAMSEDVREIPSPVDDGPTDFQSLLCWFSPQERQRRPEHQAVRGVHEGSHRPLQACRTPTGRR